MQKQKNIPQLRFPEFKGEWGKKKLGDITFKTDKKNKKKEILPVYSISNKFGFIPQSEQFNGVNSIERGYDTSLYKIIENNTFSYNPARINVGSIGYNENLGRVIVSSLYVCFQTKENVNDNFLYHFFNTTKFNNSVLTNGEGGVRIYLFYENFSSIPFSLPSLFEQKKIAFFITTIDKKISELKQKKNLLEQYKIGVMQKIFSQELRFKDNNGKDFPKWEKKKLVDFAPLQRGFDLPVNDITIGEYPVVFSNGILKHHHSFKAKAPGVVTGRSGTIGKVTYIEKNYWPHNTSLWVTDFKKNHPKFVYYFFSTYNLERFGSGSGVPTLNRNDVHIQQEYFPTLQEQVRIADFLSAIDEKISSTQSQIEKTEEYKKGLLQKMFC